MSLEAQIKALTEAVAANTEAVNAQMAMMKDAVEKATGAKAETKKAAAPKAETKAETKAKPKAETKKTKLDPDEFRSRFGRYLAPDGADKDEKDRLKNTIRPIFQRFDAERITLIDEANWPEAIAALEALETAYAEGGVDAAEAVDLFGDGGASEEADVL